MANIPRRSMIAKSLLAMTCAALLLGCTQPPAPPPNVEPTFVDPPPTVENGCFAKTAPQTVTKIITEQVLVLPESVSPDGSITSPPVFREQSRPVSETIDDGTRFETLCPHELTEERIATLQRALKARLAYDGPITGLYDTATKEAVQAFQRPSGFDSPDIARVIAAQLGVVAAVTEANR
ncbi:MAG: peptidoglycan-binding domain-containing protein [Pseudomonadota bacterium]